MPIADSVNLARSAEKADYSRIWLGEDIFHREVFTYLSILVQATEKIRLGTGITSPYVRNLPVLASSAKAVSDLFRGRFMLGLGVGGLPEIEKLTGTRPKNTVETLEKTVQHLREKLDTQIFMGVRGPKMLELAGRVADGVILSGPRGYIEKAVEIVDTASEGRHVEKVLWNAFYLGENPRLISQITSVMMDSMPGFAREYMDPARAEEELCITGPLEQVKEEIKGYEKLGIDALVVGPPYGENPVDVIGKMGVL